MTGQFWWTTMDIERHTFWGELSPTPFAQIAHPVLTDGTYRVVCGELVRILPGLPPAQKEE